MRSWRLIPWLPVVWTLAMAAWLFVHEQSEATCGPEIQRDCSIGLSVTAGLGRPGIVLLWSLGMAAFAVSSLTLTNRRLRSKTEQRSQKPSGRPQHAAGMLAAVLIAVAVVALPASTSPRSEAPPSAAETVDVRVISAILHPSGSTAGRARHAARVSVHVRLNNRGDRRIVTQPMLLSGRAALVYDRRQFTLRPLQPGVTVEATLRFEPRSAFTQRLVTQRDARLQIAGRTIPLALKIGAPVRSSRLRRPGPPAEVPPRARQAPGLAQRPAAPRPPAVAPPRPAPAPRRTPRRPAPPRARPSPPAPPDAAAPPPRQRRPATEEEFDDSG
ncbi:MAG: hypothetical protein KY463_03185 [Actinobacteria bacterium]|nr:hypothetical protein [Actinomycetota bacterium]